jgi:uncharacterized membrane protein YgcG
MWIVAITWIYVVGLMSLTEHSVVAGLMTFLGYCVLPLSILYYLAGSKRRRARNAAAGSGQLRPNSRADDEVGAADTAIMAAVMQPQIDSGNDNHHGGSQREAGSHNAHDSSLRAPHGGLHDSSSSSLRGGPHASLHSASHSASHDSAHGGFDGGSNGGGGGGADGGGGSGGGD